MGHWKHWKHQKHWKYLSYHPRPTEGNSKQYSVWRKSQKKNCNESCTAAWRRVLDAATWKKSFVCHSGAEIAPVVGVGWRQRWRLPHSIVLIAPLFFCNYFHFFYSNDSLIVIFSRSCFGVQGLHHITWTCLAQMPGLRGDYYAKITWDLHRASSFFETCHLGWADQ